MKKLVTILSIMIASSIVAAQAVIPVQSNTVLIKAVQSGNYKQVKRLLKNEKVAVNELGIDQKTALDWAVEYGDTKIAFLLAKYSGKVTRTDNSYHLKLMFRTMGKKNLITFAKMFLVGGLIFWAFGLCVALVETISLAYLAVAIPAGVGVITYAGYMWSRPFVASSMYSKSHLGWMMPISDIV